MQVEKYDNDAERAALLALVADDVVLGAVAPRWGEQGLFSSQWCNDVGKWCVEYYLKYGGAPKENIVTLFRTWALKNQDPERVKTMDRFLSSFDLSASNGNPAATLDAAGVYFNRVKLSRHWEEVKSAVTLGQLARAEDLITKYTRVELGGGSGVHLFQDEAAVRSIFHPEHRDPLVTYPGALGFFFRDLLRRGTLFAFMAPAKAGKTRWLVDLAYRAVCRAKRVAFFSIGDETQEQVFERFVVRACREPLVSTVREGTWPCVVRVPRLMLAPSNPKAKDALPEVSYDDVTFAHPLREDRAIEVMRRINASFDNESYLQISVHPNLSVSVPGVRSVLDAWSKGGWSADVVVLDYADNLAPVDSKEETRDRINTSWKLLRALSMDLHVLLVTATQTKVEGYTARWLSKGHFADDRRKVDQASGVVGVNVGPAEKRTGVCRLNWVALRGGDYDEEAGPYCAGCLALHDPAVKSVW